MAKSKSKQAKNRSRRSQPQTTARPKKILVVGDWVVDEHWVTSVHRSKTRSRTGISHYRSIQEPGGCVVTLAGAGKTTSILYDTISANERAPNNPVSESPHAQRRYDLIGVGVWHPADENTLAALLTPERAVGQTHHRLTYPPADEPKDVRLFNIGKAIRNGPECLTTRVIRVYQQEGSDYVLLDRIDWELARSEGRDLDEAFLKKELKPLLGGVDAIVIKDMAKGVVDGTLVSLLRSWCDRGQRKGRASRQPAWFVSSKEWLPPWRNELPSGAVRLFIVPQIAAHAAIHSPDYDFSRWITGDESITKEALEKIGDLGEQFPNAMICVLPIGLSVLARAKSSSGPFLFKQPVAGKGLRAEGMPMASVFLPALVSSIIEQDARSEEAGSRDWIVSREQCQTVLASALSFTEAWMRQEVQRITNSKGWTVNRRKLILHDQVSSAPESVWPEEDDLRTEPPLLARWTNSSWEESARDWDQAYRERGVIYRKTADEDGVLEIRRAMVEVDGYVCCVDAKKKVLRQLTTEIQSFDPKRGNSKAFMLMASAGAGKSYLVRKLAESLDLSLLAFNITSMLTRHDLLDCFDTIVTTQARARDKKYLVFFDEISSDLETHPVYDAFLRPLEEKIYERAGKAFYIGPCIWIFAGTKDPRDSSQTVTAQGTDFESRLSADPLMFDYEWTEKDQFDKNRPEDKQGRLENVYAAAALLKREFPDVTHVSEAVLEVFRVIEPKTPVRQIDRFIKRLDQIQYGNVTPGNLPNDWRAYLKVPAEGVRHYDENFEELHKRRIKIV